MSGSTRLPLSAGNSPGQHALAVESIASVLVCTPIIEHLVLGSWCSI